MVKNDISKIFSDNLNIYMEEKDIKQADIMRRFNVSKSTVSTWCSGEFIPRMDKIQALAEWFGIKISDLLEEKSTQKECVKINMSFPYADKEQNIINKYRCLDDSGRETVDVVLDTQYKRCVGGNGDKARFSNEIC